MAVLLLVAVAYIDEATGPNVDMDFLYTVPILLSGWYFGRVGAFSVSFASTAAWLAVRVVGRGYPEFGLGLHAWNAVMRLGVNWTVASLLLRSRLETYAVRTELDRVPRLPKIIPICAWCRKLRDTHEHWQTLEQFFGSETDVRLTHGICQTCAEQLRRESEEIGAKSRSTP